MKLRIGARRGFVPRLIFWCSVCCSRPALRGSRSRRPWSAAPLRRSAALKDDRSARPELCPRSPTPIMFRCGCRRGQRFVAALPHPGWPHADHSRGWPAAPRCGAPSVAALPRAPAGWSSAGRRRLISRAARYRPPCLRRPDGAAVPRRHSATRSRPRRRLGARAGSGTATAGSATAPRGSAFLWPVHGHVLAAYGSKSDGTHNDGINIAAPRGAAGAGRRMPVSSPIPGTSFAATAI